MRTLTLRSARALVLAGACLVLSADARAVSFQAEFSSTTFAVVPGNTYADLLAAHLAGAPLASVSLTGLENVSAQVEAGVTTNYSILLTAVLEVAVAGQYEFQVGADWGRGGVAAVIDNATATVIDEVVRTDDIWWANDWDNPDVFTTLLALDAGTSYTLVWLGFEDCCAGVTTVRFSFDGSPFEVLNEPNLEPFVIPEPRTALLLALGLTAVATRRRGEHG